MRRLSSKAYLPLSVFSLSALSLSFLWVLWSQGYQNKLERSRVHVVQELLADLKVNELPKQREIDQIVKQDKKLIYLTVSYEDKHVGSVRYPKLMAYAPKLKDLPSKKVIASLLSGKHVFSSPNIHVHRYDILSSNQLPLGFIEAGYRIPGVFPGIGSLGQGFVYVLTLFLAFGLVWTGLLVQRNLVKVAGPRYAPATKSSQVSTLEGKVESEQPSQPSEEARTADGAESIDPTAKEEMDTWLDDLEDKSEERVVDQEGRMWAVLFNGMDLSGWQAKGDWFVSQGEVEAFPWGSSMVYVKPFIPPYRFHALARVISGPDGLVLLFPVLGHQLMWVLGGWRNTKSEVSGYESTVSNDPIPRKAWMEIEVHVGKETLKGMIDGEVKWTLNTEDVQASSPNVGFESGLGLAVWNSLVRFADIRVHHEI